MTSLYDYINQQYPNMQGAGTQTAFMPPIQGADEGGSGTGKLHNILKLATTHYLHQLIGGGDKGFAPNEGDVSPELMQNIQGTV